MEAIRIEEFIDEADEYRLLVGPERVYLLHPSTEVMAEGWLISFSGWYLRRYLEQFPGDRYLPVFCRSGYVEVVIDPAMIGLLEQADSEIRGIYLNALLYRVGSAERRLNYEVSVLPALFGLIGRHGIAERQCRFYADTLGLSTKVLNHKAKLATGKTIEELVMAEVFAVSERLLVTTDRALKEIAYELGFSSPAHFNRFFKKYKQTGPAAYRQMMQR